jgi:hypothetical protein
MRLIDSVMRHMFHQGLDHRSAHIATASNVAVYAFDFEGFDFYLYVVLGDLKFSHPITKVNVSLLPSSSLIPRIQNPLGPWTSDVSLYVGYSYGN